MLTADPAKLTRLLMCGICFFGLLEAALAAGTPIQYIEPVTSVSTPSIKTVSAAEPNIFSRPVFLHGMLGKHQIQMYLHPHVDYEGSVQGDYFVLGKSAKIMVAGEFQGVDLTMEESENGTDVSGQWSGKLEGAYFRGTWNSDDQSQSERFELTIFEPKAASPSGVLNTKGKVRISGNAHKRAHRD